MEKILLTDTNSEYAVRLPFIGLCRPLESSVTSSISDWHSPQCDLEGSIDFECLPYLVVVIIRSSFSKRIENHIHMPTLRILAFPLPFILYFVVVTCSNLYLYVSLLKY